MNLRKYLKVLVLSLLPLRGLAMELTSAAFHNNGNIPNQYLHCKANASGGVSEGGNISPPLKWSNVPKGTQSFALLVSDDDVAKVPYFNSPNKPIAVNAPRITMYHWVIANIPKKLRTIPAGAGGTTFDLDKMHPGQTQCGLMGLNIYNISLNSPMSKRVLFKPSKAKISGYFGKYGGMCAGFNDKVIHNYNFVLYALNIKDLNLNKKGHFTGQELLQALTGHVIEKAQLVGKSITNPEYIR